MNRDNFNKHLYFNNIDVLRGVAIILVLIVHCTLNSGIYAKYLHMGASFGSFGVDLFFVISGFLITTILLKSKENPNYFRNFYVRRVLRIFPLYYGFIILYLFIIPLFLPSITSSYLNTLKANQFYYWLYIPNILFSLHPEKIEFFHLWSLAVEEQYYLVWPIIVFLIKPENLVKLLLVVIPLSFLLRCFFVYKGYNPFFIWSFTPIRLEAIAIGSLVAIFNVYKYSVAEAFKKYLNIALIFFSVLILIALVYNGGLYWNTTFVQTIGIFFIDVFFGFVVFKIINIPDFKKSFIKSLLETFGKYCYAIYMLHEILLNRIAEKVRLMQYELPYLDNYIKVLAIIISTSVLSYFLALISWNLYEKHFLKLKKYFQ